MGTAKCAVVAIAVIAFVVVSAGAKAGTLPSKATAAGADVKRQHDRVWINGVRKLKFSDSTNTVLACMSAAIEAAGQEIPYEYLMGASGDAFRIQTFHNTPCPCAPHAEVGYRCVELAGDAIPYDVTWTEVDKDDPESLAHARRMAIESIDEGWPVLFSDDECAVAGGYLKGGEEFLTRCHWDGDKDDYSVTTDLPRLIAVIRPGEPVDSRALAVKSLETALEMADTGRLGKFYVGFEAYDKWIGWLRQAAGDEDPSWFSTVGNAWTCECLVDARSTASKYLESIAGQFDPESAAHILKASYLYKRIAGNLRAGVQYAPYDENRFTDEAKLAEADILTTACDLEKRAIGELAKALAVSSGNNITGESGKQGDAQMSLSVSSEVPMEVKYHPAWLTWVSSVTGCLEALGVECDTVDVAGFSGYAFMMVVHDELCPSGPTYFDWNRLHNGIQELGRSTISFRSAQCHNADNKNESTIRNCREVYDVAAREIEAGRPCVVWGLYVPEFGIVTGVEDGKYIVETFKPFIGEPQPPIPYDEIDAPGGPYVLGFPAALTMPRPNADRNAVRHAVELLSTKSGEPYYHRGQAAYDAWIAALQQNKAHVFGNSYNAQCWAEAKRFARDFLSRVAGRNKAAADPLNRAVAAYSQAADAMGKVAELFPFPDTEKNVEDAVVRQQAIQALKTAKEAEARAVAALNQAAEKWPDKNSQQ